MNTADAVVVGGGVIGTAITHQLAKAGLRRVVLCEQGRVAAQGATSRSGGLLRLHHTARCDTELAARSLPVFEEWADVIGGSCGYHRTGFLMLVGAQHVPALHINTAVAQAASGAHRAEVLTPEQIHDRYPSLALEGIAAAAHEPHGGYADPVAATTALLAAGRQLGASEHEGIKVERVLEQAGRVTGVETSMGRIDSPLVVLAGGAWGAAPAEHLGVQVPVTARRIGLAQVTMPGERSASEHEHVPVCIDDTAGGYFRPDDQDRLYFGVASNPHVRPGHEVDPLTPAEVEAAVRMVSRRVQAAAKAPLAGTRAGFDGYTPDKRPVVGAAGPQGLYLALGFSGGGFKLAPAVAELAAKEITEGEATIGKHPQELLEPYRPQRFLQGRPIVPEAPYDHI